MIQELHNILTGSGGFVTLSRRHYGFLAENGHKLTAASTVNGKGHIVSASDLRRAVERIGSVGKTDADIPTDTGEMDSETDADGDSDAKTDSTDPLKIPEDMLTGSAEEPADDDTDPGDEPEPEPAPKPRGRRGRKPRS